MREELQNKVDSMLVMGVVRPSKSHYAIVLVEKKDGSNRVCGLYDVEQDHGSRP